MCTQILLLLACLLTHKLVNLLVLVEQILVLVDVVADLQGYLGILGGVEVAKVEVATQDKLRVVQDFDLEGSALDVGGLLEPGKDTARV